MVMKDKSSIPLVSIAVCTFNGEKYLREQLDSLVYQDYSNLEIVVIDDGSSDGTWNILRDYSDRFSFIKIYQNELNLGYIRNFERAISKCSGEYIALSDQDDIWELHKVRTLYNNINDHVLIYHDSNIINEFGESLNRKMSDVINLYEGGDFRPFLFMNCISGHSMLFRRSLVERFTPFSDACFHDWWIAYIAVNYGTIGLVEESLVYYRQHEGSTTDILRNKLKGRNNGLHISTQELVFKQLAYWKTHSNSENYNYVNDLYNLISKSSRTPILSFKLFVFLLRNMNSLFYVSKKSLFSKFNLVRKLAGSYKLHRNLTMHIACLILPNQVESIIHITCD